MKWVYSEGGPLIVVADSELHLWNGCTKEYEPQDDEPDDYGRACSVDEYVGAIPVGAYDALILGDEPMQTAWSERDAGKCFWFIRWVYADSEEDIMRALDLVDDAMFSKDSIAVEFGSSRVCLFDSALSGVDAWELDETSPYAAKIDLPGSRFSVETAEAVFGDTTSLVIHRLLLT